MNIKCYDIENQELKHLTQWDLNQKIIIKNISLTSTPEIHFSNLNSKNALRTESTYHGDEITVEVPNILLQESLPISLYVYEAKPDDSAKTTHVFRIPVLPRPKPDGYIYTDNAYYMSLENLKSILNSSEEIIHNVEEATTRAINAAELAEDIVTQNNNFKNNISNAIKRKESGKVVRINNVSPIEHTILVKLKSQYLNTDITFSAGDLISTGKNLWTGRTDSGKYMGTTVDFTAAYYPYYPVTTLPAGVPYTFTAYVTSTDIHATTCSIGLGYINEDGSTTTKIIGALQREVRNSIHFTPEKDVKYIALYSGTNGSDGIGDKAVYTDIQLEVGEVGTEFEEYKSTDLQTYTPAADGTIDIISESSTMTFFTYKDGVIIECEYNKDLNAVLNDIKSDTDIDNEMFDGSTNPVESQAIQKYVKEKIDEIEIPETQNLYDPNSTNPASGKAIEDALSTLKTDNVMSINSSNPVENKVITNYIDNKNAAISASVVGFMSRHEENTNETLAEMRDEINSFTSRIENTEKTVETLNNEGLSLKEEVIRDQVNVWLNNNSDTSTTTVEDGSITLKKLKHGELFLTPQMFEDPDNGLELGKGDDRAVLEAMFAEVKDNSYVFFPKGEYVISSLPLRAKMSTNGKETYWGVYNSASNFFKIDKTNVTIDLNGSTIKFEPTEEALSERNNQIKKDNPEYDGLGFSTYKIFYFSNAKNFVLQNGVIKGDRLTHDYKRPDIYIDFRTNTQEWGYGVDIRAEDASTDVCYGVVKDIEVYDCIGDGININNGHREGSFVKVVNCNVHHCRRDGITIGDSSNVVIDGCYVHHIGDFDNIQGTMGKIGINLEAEKGEFRHKNIIIKNTKIDNNTELSISCSSDSPVKLDKDETKPIYYETGDNSDYWLLREKTGDVTTYYRLKNTNNGNYLTDDMAFEMDKNHDTITSDKFTTEVYTPVNSLLRLNKVRFHTDKIIIDNCDISGAFNLEGRMEGIELNWYKCSKISTNSSPKTITNSTLSQNASIRAFHGTNTTVTNCIVNAYPESDKYTNISNSIFVDPLNLRFSDSERGVLLERCTINLGTPFANKEDNKAGISQGTRLNNCTVNGGRILIQAQSNITIRDCKNTIFNGCEFRITSQRASAIHPKYFFISCSFLGCYITVPESKPGGNPLFRNCYFDKKIFTNTEDKINGHYLNCSFEEDYAGV